jgi:hypothetical protein
MKIHLKGFLEWIKLAGRCAANGPAGQYCIACGHHGLELRYFRTNSPSSIGYLWVTCPGCRRGVHVSRVEVPSTERGSQDEEGIAAFYKTIDWVM